MPKGLQQPKSPLFHDIVTGGDPVIAVAFEEVDGGKGWK